MRKKHFIRNNHIMAHLVSKEIIEKDLKQEGLPLCTFVIYPTLPVVDQKECRIERFRNSGDSIRLRLNKKTKQSSIDYIGFQRGKQTISQLKIQNKFLTNRDTFSHQKPFKRLFKTLNHSQQPSVKNHQTIQAKILYPKILPKFVVRTPQKKNTISTNSQSQHIQSFDNEISPWQ